MNRVSLVLITLLTLAAVLGYGATGTAQTSTTLEVGIRPTSNTVVAPWGAVDYEIFGTLTGDASLGLALWGIDLHSSYAIPGGLPQLLPGPEMSSFVRPEGITNPAGYGGTPDGADWLRQIGGGQNTIGNPGPDPPMGEVVLGIGLSEVVLAEGTAYLPGVNGTYQLELSSLFCNVITGEGVGDPPVFPVSAAVGVVGPSSLDVIVIPEPATMSLLALGGLALLIRRRRAA